jgi:hypothetical protein
MNLSLETLGQRIESEAGTGTNASCEWTGANGVANAIDPGNCWRPALWFLPDLSLQSSLLPSYLVVSDLGTSPVGQGSALYRHLQCELLFSNLSGDFVTYMATRSTSDLGLDPVSLLPAVLAYSVLPDNGEPTPIAMEIRYSQYQLVQGVEIPFHIQRYVNGSLQLDILVNSAQIN